MSIRKLAAITAVAVVVGILMGAPPGTSIAQAATAGDQVSICHFAGHDGDFVTFNSAGNNNTACLDLGGNAIKVGVPACKRGHNAQQVFANRSCDDGDLQP